MAQKNGILSTIWWEYSGDYGIYVYTAYIYMDM
jgi:hypothetical protein